MLLSDNMATAPLARSGPKEIRHKSLSAYYPRLSSLAAVLMGSSLTLGDTILYRATDLQEYKDLLEQTICATSNDVPALPPLEPVQRGVGPSHTEVVDGILHELGRRTNARDDLCITKSDTLLLGLSVRLVPYGHWSSLPKADRVEPL